VCAGGGDAALPLAVAGSLVVFVAIFLLDAGLRCPACGRNLVRALCWPPARVLDLSDKIRECPVCGAPFGARVDGGEAAR
jgi:hypothetical protein